MSLFDTLIVQPIFNLLMVIYGLLPGHDFGISLIIFTVLIRLVMWPLVKKQLHQTKVMQSIQPELKKIKDVHFLGFISEGEKRWLYQNAVAMTHASLSEGFCIPLLEAMYEGCPVVASNASCLPEVAGDAALYFDPNSTTDLANKLCHLLNTPAMSELLREKGYKRVKQFSWQRMAEQTIKVYKEVLGN